LQALLELADQTARHDDTGNRAEAVPLVDRAKVITAITGCASRLGDYAEARASAEEGTSLWRQVGEDLPLAISLNELGLLDWLQGDPRQALEYLDESRRVFERCETNPVTVAFTSNVLRALGMVARSAGDYVRAAEYFRESVVRARRGAPTGGYTEARGLCHLGRTLFLQGEVQHARQVFGEALGVMQAERLAGHALADCLDWLAALAGADGRPREAAQLFGAAEPQWQASGAVRYAPEQSTYAAEVASVETRLGAVEFEAAWAEGKRLSRERAIELGLEVCRTPSVFIG
jgi:non-specific serine/threonine protein kinase